MVIHHQYVPCFKSYLVSSMHVIFIDVDSLRYDTRRGRHVALVRFHSQDEVVGIEGRSDLPADASAEARQAALRADALRQLRRMPEFRRNASALSFASGVLPDPG